MRAIVGAFCIVLLYSPAVLGKSLYVKGYNEVTVRAGPSLQTAVLAVLKTGQQVTLVGDEGKFYLVSLPNGTKGYMVKTYLTDQVPADIRLRDAEARLQTIEQQTPQRLKELEAQVQAQEKELHTLRAERTQLIAAKQEESTASLQSQVATQIQARQNTIDEDDLKFHWFMAGAGVLFIGWLLGRVGGVGRRRDRRSMLKL